MSQDAPKLFETSRRQVLAGLGAVGLASAGAGLGTTAYFSDTESFQGNSLQAGRLDLMLDYKASYDGPNGPELIGQAPTEQQLIDQYGEQATDFDGPLTWEQRADLGFSCDTNGLINGEAMPVFDLDDVKPGDYGEVTMSFHICDNPAHVFFRANVLDDLENGITEPEGQAELEDGTDAGELADSIDVRMWYDEDCSNTYDENTGSADVLIVQDISGSMEYSQNGGVIADGQGGQTTKLAVAKDAIEAFGNQVFTSPADIEVGLFTFGNEDYIGADTPSGDDVGIELAPTDDQSALNAAVSAVEPAALGVGGTALGLAVQEANDYLQANARSSATPVMIVLTDGEQFDSNVDELAAANQAKSEGTRIVMIDINDLGDGEPQLLRDMAGSTQTVAGDGDGTDYYQSADADFADAAIDIFDSILQTIVVAEGIVFEGTLAEFGAFAADGIHLDPAPLLGDDVSNEICFRPGTHCVAFEWSVDTAVGNEIQTDSVSFDFDFAAVQCRHNDEPVNPFVDAD